MTTRRLVTRPGLVLLLTVGLATLSAGPAAGASSYTMTDLGSLGYGVTYGFGINGTGEVVGRSYLTTFIQFKCGRHICTEHFADPFSWSAGTMTDLGTLGGTFSEARAVNGGGDVVGGSNGEAFLDHNRKLRDLGPGEAMAINDNGVIVGNASPHAFVVNGGVRSTLPDLSSYGGGISSASGLNLSGQIVGSSDNAAGENRAVTWNGGAITDLGTLGGTQSAAYAVNNLGQVTGWAHTASEATHLFLYTNGRMTDLGTFGLDPVGEAINDHCVIVGEGGNGPFVWSDGTFKNLNALVPARSGFTLADATAINANGQIVADGVNASGQHHAFLLSPA
jgi:probable HAF family extracellular repeat protein